MPPVRVDAAGAAVPVAAPDVAVAAVPVAGWAAPGCCRTTVPPPLPLGTSSASAPPVPVAVPVAAPVAAPATVSPATFLPAAGTASMTSRSAGTVTPDGET